MKAKFIIQIYFVAMTRLNWVVSTYMYIFALFIRYSTLDYMY